MIPYESPYRPCLQAPPSHQQTTSQKWLRSGYSLTLSSLTALLLTSCNRVPPFFDAYGEADALAKKAGYESEWITTQKFNVRTIYSPLVQDKDLMIYLEGDGHAFRSSGRPYDDPTPAYPLGLELAIADRSPNVVYIARPCQYVIRNKLDPNCEERYWTRDRFSAPIIDAVNSVIDQFVSRTKGKRVHLVGYSGGGAVALLISTRREDAATVRTVSGNIDHVAVNVFHTTHQLTGSLDPLDDVVRLARIPQIHFVGSDDEIVPPLIARGYERKVASACVTVHEEPGVTHVKGWSERWTDLSQLVPSCR